ncbi:Mariner Mos1 transposase [Eumeta japonica]|uniref:Mariner Mos1 transposase n=1 Tax=Eumeta variegata TaxID=151549 RepID=A0A4C1YH51_EUMVA|nr:Mariner Mos1 transposase [Eumeta japonica]
MNGGAVCRPRRRQWARRPPPRAAPRRESRRYFRERVPADRFNLHRNSRKLSQFSERGRRRPHPRRPAARRTLRGRRTVEIRPRRARSKLGRAVCSCLGIHFRVGRSCVSTNDDTLRGLQSVHQSDESENCNIASANVENFTADNGLAAASSGRRRSSALDYDTDFYLDPDTDSDVELEETLEEDLSQVQKELALILEVTQQAVSNRLKSLGMIHKQDILPSDYHLFRSMAHAPSEQRLTSYEDTKNWADSWIASKDKEFFRLGIRTLPERWKKVVASDGQYVD